MTCSRHVGRGSRRRLPVGGLLPLLTARVAEHGGLRALCRYLDGRCGLSAKGWEKVICRSRSEGWVTELQAERLAVVLGSSVEDVWGRAAS